MAASRADLDAAKQELAGAIADATNRVVSTISDLQSQIANGSPITDADLEDLKNDVQSLSNIDAAPSPQPGPAPGPATPGR